MFKNCQSLRSLDLSGWDTKNVTDMGGMFYYCVSLSSLNLAGWNTKSVDNMGDMFNNCKSLESLDLSGWDVRSVSYGIYNMFTHCFKVRTIMMKGCDDETVRIIKEAVESHGNNVTIIRE